MTAQDIFCPICKKETYAQGPPDSIGTQFYKCETGHQTTKAITDEQKKLALAFEIQAEQNDDKSFVDPLNPMASFCDEKGHFKPALLALYFKHNHHFKADQTTEILYYFDGKSWSDNGEVHLQKLIAKILEEENNHSIFINVLHDLKGLVYEDVLFSRKIAVENGLLDLENENIELEPFSHEEMPFHYLPTTYDKTATCTSWEEFVKQVVNSDDIATLQEWSGYLLLPDYRFHKLLWVHGEGRNGKGVWQRTMEAILGENNISGVGLEEFDGKHRFALRQLYGSLFNPCSEPITSEDKGLQTSLLKKATGQDTIDSEIKGKQKRLKFRNCAKITVLANRFPKIFDTSTAFKERRLFIKFPNEFTGKNQIQNIEQNWLNDPKQKSGILNWMLAGLKRLLEQGYFTESKTQEQTEIEYKKASDSIGAFLSEMGIFNKTYTTTRAQAYEEYKNYCDIFALYTCSEHVFTARLKETPKISVTTVSHPTKLRAWKGITFKKLDDEGKISEAVSTVSEVSLLDTVYPQKVKDPILNIQDKKDDTSDTADTIKPQLKIVAEVSGLRHLEVTCIECGKFHLPTCSYPGDCEKVPADHWAGECRYFIKKQADMPNFDDKDLGVN